jgi:hypothetical protein
MSDFIRKISSRKFWLAAAGVTCGIAMVFGVTESEIATVSGTVMAMASAMSYIFVEGKLDLKRLKNAAEALTGGADGDK